MKKTDLSTIENEVEKGVVRQLVKRKKKMKVSGARVKQLARIIKGRSKA